jgi:hypothetical protein
MLWRVEDNPTDKRASDMAVTMFNTAKHKSVNPLNVTVNSAQQIEAMMRQTPEIDADEMIDEEEEVPDEEPPEDHVNKKEGEMAPLDALYPMMRVSSNAEKQQTLHRVSTMPESTHQEAVKNETYRENRSNAKNVVGEIAPLDALYPMMRVLSDYEKQKTTHRMSTMHESTYQEDVMTKTYRENRKSDVHVSTYQEDVMDKTYRENTMSAMHESTYQEDVQDNAYMENIDVPGAVANTSSSNYGPEDPQNSGKTGTKDDTKRPA